MKTLLLMRHAKSDWHAAYGTDHDRPLAPRGREAAPRMGRFLTRVGFVPDHCVTSSAVRARHTVELAAAAGEWASAGAMEVTDFLYEASEEDLVPWLAERPDEIETLLLAGHEPVWSALTARLMGGGHVRMPTAAVACLRWPVETWRRALETPGQLLWLVTPKILKGR